MDFRFPIITKIKLILFYSLADEIEERNQQEQEIIEKDEKFLELRRNKKDLEPGAKKWDSQIL